MIYCNEMFCSEPTHNNDLVDGCLPIQNDRVHYLDVTNDGLKVGVNPNHEANELWDQIEQQITQINAEEAKSMREEL